MPRWSWAVVVLVGCGGGGAARTDAGNDAATSDAAPADAVQVDSAHADAPGDAAIAQLAASSAALAFGTQTIGTTSATQVVTITNAGGATTGVLAGVLGGANPTLFTSVDTCAGASLAPGATCTATVRFAPTALGAASATLQIAGTSGGTLTIALSGTGLEGGFITINPSLKDFGNAIVGAQTVATTFTVANAGPTATVPLAVALGGVSPTSFTIVSDGCTGQAIAPGGTCGIALWFGAVTAGLVTASLAVTGPNTATAALTGTGVFGPDLAINPSAHDFGAVPVGLHTASTDFTITNPGSIATGTPTVALAGTNPSQFHLVASTCAAAIAPGASCTVTVRFEPDIISNDTATLAVTATPGGTATASLFGQAVSTAALEASPNTLVFGDVAVSASATLTFTVTNPNTVATGPIATTFSGTDVAMFQTVASTCSTLAPNASCTFDIAFSPTSTGLKTAAVLVTAPTIGSVSVAFSGTGN